MTETSSLSRPVDMSTIGLVGSEQKIEATENERLKACADLGLVDIRALAAVLVLNRNEDSTIHVTGRVAAEIVQTCVFSLDPVNQTIDEPIALSIVQENRKKGSDITEAVEVNIDPDQDDPPEIITGPVLDLGTIVLEHFILAIDPYPRAPGAEAPINSPKDAVGASDSPFSVLADLHLPKKKDG